VPCLVADAEAAEQVDVVITVQIDLDSRGPLGTQLSEELVEEAPASTVLMVGGQEKRQRRQ
jgi:hypothetical protein